MDRNRKLFMVLLLITTASIWYWHRVIMGNTESSVVTTDLEFNGVRVRTYMPPTTDRTLLPGIVYFHGGGWINGSIDTRDPSIRVLSAATKTFIVSVDYRLAPRVIFPEPFDDCLVATKYFFRHLSEFGVDRHRLAVMGDSAGGNLAAAVALRLLNDNFKPALKLQILLYPVLQGFDFQLPSMLRNRKPPGLTSGAMCRYTSLYLYGRADFAQVLCANRHVPADVRQKYAATYLNVDRLPVELVAGYVRPEQKPVDEFVWSRLKNKLMSQYFAPLFADTLVGLPATYLLTIERDPLRDEGLLYVERLKQDGVDVTHRHSLFGRHGWLEKRLDSVIEFIDNRL